MGLSVEGALQHEYLSLLHCPDDEPCASPVATGLFEFERRRVTRKVLREELFLEALLYHPNASPRPVETDAHRALLDCPLFVPGETFAESDSGDDGAQSSARGIKRPRAALESDEPQNDGTVRYRQSSAASKPDNGSVR